MSCRAVVSMLLLSTGLVLAVSARAGLDEGLAAYAVGNFDTAAREFATQAELGDATAQYHLAVLYEDGQGVDKDLARAAHWYRQAADQGDVDAYFALGMLHAKGKGVARDMSQAYFWLDQAAAYGHHRAREEREKVARRIEDAKQLAEVQRRAREWRLARGH